jgi:hypothetical protein
MGRAAAKERLICALCHARSAGMTGKYFRRRKESMKRFTILLLTIFVALSLGLAACQPVAPKVAATEAPAIVVPATEAPATAAPVNMVPTVAGPIALKVTGNVAKEQGWSEAEVKTMKTLDVQFTNKKGKTETYTGVLITDLLAAAQPNGTAVTVIFVADDGFTAEVGLKELNACVDCIVSFRDQGGFSTVLPNFPGNLQVKGVVEIKVK